MFSMKAFLKTSLVLASFVMILSACAAAPEAKWTTDFEQARKQAKTEKKLILLNFTGSDFCVGCKALHKNVFSKNDFATFASKRLVLVELDFPEEKPQSEELRRTNQELMEMFKVDGFPTIIVLDSSGKEVKRMLGYGGEDVDAYVKKLKELDK